MFVLSVSMDDFSIDDDGPGTLSVLSQELVSYQGRGGLFGLPGGTANFEIGDLRVELTCERNAGGKIDFSILHDGDLALLGAYYGPFSMRVFARDDIDYVVELEEIRP